MLQVAGDGTWESAVVVPVSSDTAALAGIVQQVAASANNDVAVEVMWPGQLFAGVRWGVAQVEEAVGAAQRVSSVLQTPATTAPVSALVSLLGVVPEGDPELAELGAVNAWSSARPSRLWRQGDQLEVGTVLDEALTSRPDLMECSNPVALEIAATDPRPWWIGVVVSTPVGSAHRVDRRLLEETLRRGVGAAA